MPVQRETISAISSAPTCVRNSRGLPDFGLSACFNCASSCGSLPYCSSATLSNLPWRWSCTIRRERGRSLLDMRGSLHLGFLGLQISFRGLTRARAAISSPIRPGVFRSFVLSFFTASRSIFNWIRRRSSWSISSGWSRSPS